MRSTLPSTRRLPLAAGAVLTAVAVAVLSACTGTGSSDGADKDGKTGLVGGDSAASAPPGKYQTLPQPCTSVDADSLKKLVPGLADYSGTESLTYDIDRLVGCSWKAKAADGTTRSLNLSLVRVVSYNPSVSDEAQATTDFDKKAQAASIPLTPPGGSSASATPTATGGGSGGGSGDDADDAASGSGTPSSGPTDAAGSGDGENTGTDSAGLAPRLLSGVGNAAFINDVAKTPGKGSSRTVTLVFRTANVLATVTYTQSSATDAQPPKSADLQKDAEKVAGDLQHKVEG
ncbi:hypothetical protein RVR_5977 [Actinacidiphila reveromycinica]|uniref:DUF3558 domain-containing protein n=1 Tax=Actinacidiphila reveromycinica TaxID=659352 RepID=A0A7U3UVI0_9ACTN|nr:hypothetical protein [Streptomyces sp. SN-593]BBA99381.1 hypothetical protein RVR_5977 [Streptomyces sp. SN-593]